MMFRILILVISYFIFSSCSDIVYQKEEDLLKYDYLSPFIIKEGEYIKGILNLDTNELLFYYKVEKPNVILNKIEKQAICDGWVKYNNIYLKEVSIYDNSDRSLIKIEIFKEREVIKVLVK